MTFAEIADELGVDERSARRIVDTVLAKLQRAFVGTEHTPEMVAATLVVLLRERHENYSSSEKTISRRFSPDPGSCLGHAARARKPLLPGGENTPGRVRRLPRRWSR